MKRAVLVAVVSLVLGVLGATLVTRESPLDAASFTPVRPSLALGAATLACLAVVWFVPALRLYRLAHLNGHRIGMGTAWLAHVVMVFGTAVTPGGTGGAPALVAALARVRVPMGTGIGIATQMFILDLIVFAVLVPLGLLHTVLARTLVLAPHLQVLGVVAAVAALAGAVALGRFPRPVVALLLRLARMRLLRRWSTSWRRAARSYYRSTRSFASLRVGGWTWLLFVTAAGWMSNFALLWVLLVTYGRDVPLLDVMAMLSVVTLVSFVVPTPGGAGFTEAAAGLGAGVHAAAATAALLLWRIGTFYGIYLIGPVASWLSLGRATWAATDDGGSATPGRGRSTRP